MAADTASDRSISGDVRDVLILVDPLWSVGADGKRVIESAITAKRPRQTLPRRRRLDSESSMGAVASSPASPRAVVPSRSQVFGPRARDRAERPAVLSAGGIMPVGTPNCKPVETI